VFRRRSREFVPRRPRRRYLRTLILHHFSDSVRIILATRNPGKVAELRALLADLPVDLVSAAEVEGAPEVEEDAPTLEGNARKKAAALHAHTGLPALADDTGLEVNTLDGAPGVHSARFAGPDADAEANRARLLRDLGGAADRSARFRTVLAFADGDEVRYFDGVCPGAITEAECGEGGFGYDALFQPEGETRTFAEMPAEAKNAISHRGRALAGFAAYLRRRLAQPS
jgi:XTP/dITP diphosphohydrolase